MTSRLSVRSLFTLVCVCLAMGGLLRMTGLRDVSIEHFDEGVYASNLLIGPPDYRYPFQQFYAPPLLPTVLEWISIFAGVDPVRLLSFSVLVGLLLPGAICWTTRELLQRGTNECAGMATVIVLCLAVCSEMLIQYSRAALTDILLTFWFTLAVGCGARGFRRESWIWSLLAGLFTALAWWTKYNGWLPLAVLGAGMLGWGVIESRDWKRVVRLSLQWGVVTGIACLLWLPCLSALQTVGGYAAVAANHAGYVVGPAGWWDALQRHLQVDRFYSGPLTAVGLLFGMGCAAVWRPVSSQGERMEWSSPVAGGWLALGLAVTGLAATGLACWGGAIPVLTLLTMIGAASFLLEKPASFQGGKGETVRSSDSAETSAGLDRLGYWILAAWILGLLVATPLYRPYPRLILPLLVGLMIGGAAGTELLLVRIHRRLSGKARGETPGGNLTPSDPMRASSRWQTGLAWGMSACLLGGALILPRVFPSPAFEGRRELQDLAPEIVSAIQADLGEQQPTSGREPQIVVAVFGEPGLFFHLARPGISPRGWIVQPIGTTAPLLGTSRSDAVATYLITGPHSRDEAADIGRQGEQVRLVKRFDYHPSSLVLLDDHPPAEIGELPAQEIQVWTQRR